ncbi:hypothetical protein ACFX1W_022278 [Malus domestica]
MNFGFNITSSLFPSSPPSLPRKSSPSLLVAKLLKTFGRFSQSILPINPLLMKLTFESNFNVIPVRLHFCETIPQSRQPISHGRVCVNNGTVSITYFKVSQEIHKGHQIVEEFLHTAKSFSYSLASIGEPISSFNKDLVLPVLRGLDRDYIMLHTSILNTHHLPYLSELRILTFKSTFPHF